MTMVGRSAEKISPLVALSEQEIKILDFIKPDTTAKKRKDLSNYVIKIAQLGGYLARASDPPPGNTVIWRGITRLSEIQLGVEIGMKLVGN